MIMQCLLDEYMISAQERSIDIKAMRLPVVLSLVSKSWKNFVYNHPHLWSYMTLDYYDARPRNFRVLKARLSRTQNVPLKVEIRLSKKFPNNKMLTTLFSHSKRISELSIFAVDLGLWWKKSPATSSFCQLEKLTVNMQYWSLWDQLLFAVTHLMPESAHLHSLGHTLYGASLRHLTVNCAVPIARVVDMLVACPNLVSVDIKLATGTPRLKNRTIMAASLTSLDLQGSILCTNDFLRNVHAPLLSKLDISLWSDEVYHHSILSLSLSQFLSRSPLLEDLTVNSILDREDILIEILSTQPRITRLVIVIYSENLLTRKAFELLTYTAGGNALLPRLKHAEFRCKVDVDGDTIVNMLESRHPNIKYMYLSSQVLTQNAMERLEKLGYHVNIKMHLQTEHVECMLI